MIATAMPTHDRVHVNDITGPIEKVVRDRLSGWVQNFHVDVRDRGIVLTGRTRSYYAKQLVQHAALSASRLPLLANEIQVQ